MALQHSTEEELRERMHTARLPIATADLSCCVLCPTAWSCWITATSLSVVSLSHPVSLSLPLSAGRTDLEFGDKICLPQVSMLLVRMPSPYGFASVTPAHLPSPTSLAVPPPSPSPPCSLPLLRSPGSSCLFP